MEHPRPVRLLDSLALLLSEFVSLSVSLPPCLSVSLCVSLSFSLMMAQADDLVHLALLVSFMRYWHEMELERAPREPVRPPSSDPPLPADVIAAHAAASAGVSPDSKRKKEKRNKDGSPKKGKKKKNDLGQSSKSLDTGGDSGAGECLLLTYASTRSLVPSSQ